MARHNRENEPRGRDVRQRSIIDPERLQRIKATIIGVGAIGRQVALQLAAVGVPYIQLIDFDSVEDHNQASQGFGPMDVGKAKVRAVAETVHNINHNVRVEKIDEAYRGSHETHPMVFCCVDKIETREHLSKVIIPRSDLFVDGRMGAETIRIITAHDDESREYYPTTLFSAEEALQEPCTARSTIYTANIAAGFMVSQLTMRMRDLPLNKDLLFTLLGMEMIKMDQEATVGADAS
jgi:sulfur carrier protein ThiS adenylyltransferase